MSSEAKTVTEQNAAELAQWCDGRVVEEIDPFDDSVRRPGINVLCHGQGGPVKRASVGQIIIRQHNGTFDVYDPYE